MASTKANYDRPPKQTKKKRAAAKKPAKRLASFDFCRLYSTGGWGGVCGYYCHQCGTTNHVGDTAPCGLLPPAGDCNAGAGPACFSLGGRKKRSTNSHPFDLTPVSPLLGQLPEPPPDDVKHRFDRPAKAIKFDFDSRGIVAGVIICKFKNLPGTGSAGKKFGFGVEVINYGGPLDDITATANPVPKAAFLVEVTYQGLPCIVALKQ